MVKNAPRLLLRTLEPNDYQDLSELMELVFHDVGGA